MRGRPVIRIRDYIAAPDKLSTLVRLAIDDALSLQYDEYEPNAGAWHEPMAHTVPYDADPFPWDERQAGNRLVCHVCLAGAVIAGTLAAPRDLYVAPSEMVMRRHWADAINALENVRRGEYGAAVSHMIGRFPDGEDMDNLLAIPKPEYMSFQGWEEFRLHLDSLNDIADLIEEAGF